MNTASTNGGAAGGGGHPAPEPRLFQPPGPRLAHLALGAGTMYGGARANWAARFAWVASLLLDPPRDQHGHFTDDSEHREIVAGWLDALNLDDPQTPDDSQRHYILVAFELPEMMREALAQLMREAPGDINMSDLVRQLVIAHLRQSYALPE